MSESPLSSPLEKTVVIVGVGLIGGSLAAVLKQKKLAQMVIGVGRDAKRIEAARLAGIIDEATTDIATVIDRADLVVFCTPVDHRCWQRQNSNLRVARGYPAIYRVASDCRFTPPGF
jgi:glutamyl-tRNA reductase